MKTNLILNTLYYNTLRLSLRLAAQQPFFDRCDMAMNKIPHGEEEMLLHKMHE